MTIPLQCQLRQEEVIDTNHLRKQKEDRPMKQYITELTIWQFITIYSMVPPSSWYVSWRLLLANMQPYIPCYFNDEVNCEFFNDLALYCSFIIRQGVYLITFLAQLCSYQLNCIHEECRYQWGFFSHRETVRNCDLSACKNSNYCLHTITSTLTLFTTFFLIAQ